MVIARLIVILPLSPAVVIVIIIVVIDIVIIVVMAIIISMIGVIVIRNNVARITTVLLAFPALVMGIYMTTQHLYSSRLLELCLLCCLGAVQPHMLCDTFASKPREATEFSFSVFAVFANAIVAGMACKRQKPH